MTMKHHPSVTAFLRECEEALVREPAENSLMLGLLHGFKEASKPHLLFSVERGGQIQVCGLQTAPTRPLILTFLSDDEKFDFIEALRTQAPSLTSVVGTEPAISSFADTWGVAVSHRVEQTVFELKEVDARGFVDQGVLTPVSEKHREVIKEWITAFQNEALPNEPFSAQDAADYADAVLSNHSLYLLNVGADPVAMAAITRPTSLGASINAVYTPPNSRKKGFASTLVAKLCQQILHGGKKRCWLYADKGNPTANHIYVNIGFRRVCDSAHVTFASQV